MSAIVASILNYSTAKTVQIRSKSVGLIFRFIQLFIVGYVVGYVIVYNKGYQEYDNAVSAVSTKVKGIGATCRTNGTALQNCSDDQVRVWDTVDYVIPPEENNAFFVITTAVETLGQVQGIFDEDEHYANHPCTNSSDCLPFKFNASTNGVIADSCNLGQCQIFTWGPVETYQQDQDSQNNPDYYNRIPQSANFTVFIKNNVLFPKFGNTFSNLDNGNLTNTNIATCHWSPSDPFCPVYTLADIAYLAGVSSFDSVIASGVVLAVQIDWNCNLDASATKCIPTFAFYRLDTPNSTVSDGYNFRTGQYSTIINGTSSYISRDLTKAYGTRVVFVVSGVAGKFNIVPLFVTLGSGLALLSIATILADIITTKILKKRDFYYAKKYETIDDEEYEAFLASRNVGGAHEASPLLAVNQ